MLIFAILHVDYLLFYLAPASIFWASEIAKRVTGRVCVSAKVQSLGPRLLRVVFPPASRAAAWSFLKASGCPNAVSIISPPLPTHSIFLFYSCFPFFCLVLFVFLFFSLSISIIVSSVILPFLFYSARYSSGRSQATKRSWPKQTSPWLWRTPVFYTLVLVWASDDTNPPPVYRIYPRARCSLWYNGSPQRFPREKPTFSRSWDDLLCPEKRTFHAETASVGHGARCVIRGTPSAATLVSFSPSFSFFLSFFTFCFLLFLTRFSPRLFVSSSRIARPSF